MNEVLKKILPILEYEFYRLHYSPDFRNETMEELFGEPWFSSRYIPYEGKDLKEQIEAIQYVVEHPYLDYKNMGILRALPVSNEDIIYYANLLYQTLLNRFPDEFLATLTYPTENRFLYFLITGAVNVNSSFRAYTLPPCHRQNLTRDTFFKTYSKHMLVKPWHIVIVDIKSPEDIKPIEQLRNLEKTWLFRLVRKFWIFIWKVLGRQGKQRLKPTLPILAIIHNEYGNVDKKKLEDLNCIIYDKEPAFWTHQCQLIYELIE